MSVTLDAGPRHPVLTVTGWELDKLIAQVRVRLALAVCLLGPFAFAFGLKLASNVPADTLFGRWVRDSGFAIPLVVLGFAGSWGFPVLSCLVAGDIFSSEDHYGTWATILTRSVSRRSVFVGKALAVAVWVVAAAALLTAASLAAGLLLVGHQPLVDLGGIVRTSGSLTTLVVLSWLSVVPAMLTFAALGVLCSIASRSSVVGIGVPVLLGLVLQLALSVNGLGPALALLPNWSFVAWHGLFAEPAFTGPLIEGIAVSVGYIVVCLGIAWRLFARRDIAGSR